VGSAAMKFPSASMSLPGSSVRAGDAPAAVPGGSAATPAGSAAIADARSAGARQLAAGGVGEDAPPDRLPPGAALGMAQMAFTDANMHFNSAQVAASSAHFAAPGAAVLPGGMEFREEGRGLRITLDADVLFDFDRAELRRDAGPRLQRLMEEVSARIPRPAFRVEGHTDWVGSDAYNLRLSARRAESVRNWLVQSGGVPRPAISTVGYGESRPVAPNSTPDGRDDPEGRQRNRRVELLVTPR
jgi:outer membrane protein OmpA-like peptidoglycan-associated protein